MRVRHALLVLSLGLSTSAGAQKVLPEAVAASGAVRADGCSLGSASALLDISDVRAELFNIGNLFWRGGDEIYWIPRESRVSALFNLGLWVGGDVAGETRFAGSAYGPYEFWPGPLDASGQTDAATCERFDRLWSVTIEDVVTYERNGVAPDDLAEWPVAYGAPFYLDADGNGEQDPEAEPVIELGPGDDGYGMRTLDLDGGERPLLLGDQAVFWIMNDAGDTHTWGGTAPLGIEVHAYAFSVNSSDGAVARSTFYRYTIHNRSGETIEDSRVSFFADIALGDYGDNFIASDSTRGMLIGYNGDESDVAYGSRPPAIGLDVLSGAAGVMAFLPSISSNPSGGPIIDVALRGQQSRWGDGVPLTVGGDGYNPGTEEFTSWLYGGDPVRYGFWTEESSTPGASQSNIPGDRRAILNAPPVTLAPGESRRVDLAILFGQGENRMHSIVKLRAASDSVQAAYDRAGFGTVRAVVVGAGPSPPSPPASGPALLTPASGADFEAAGRPDTVAFAWGAVAGADVYDLEFSADADFQTVVRLIQTRDTSIVLHRDLLPVNSAPPSYWRVTPRNWGGVGPAPETRAFTYRVYSPLVVTLSDGQLAFVEITGPGGADPCSPEAESTDGCDEAGGNPIYRSLNSTGDYIGTSVNNGTEFTLPQFAPNDYEIRFTEAGGYALYGFTTDHVIPVPFEIWDIGVVPLGAENDPSDDIRLIPFLLSDIEAETADEKECTFGYLAEPRFNGEGRSTQRIYGYYPQQTYEDFAREAEEDLAADDNACAVSLDAAATVDTGRGRPMQRFVLNQTAASTRGIDELIGTVIRFYTTDPYNVPSELAPEAGALSVAVHPNPVRATASVPYTLAASGRVRLRVVDVLGREVAVLVDGERPAGEHRAAFDAHGLAAGVYVVVLDTEAERATRTITVAR